MKPEGVNSYNSVFPNPQVIQVSNFKPVSLLVLIGPLKYSTCLILTKLSDYPMTNLVVCDVTNSIVRNFESC